MAWNKVLLCSFQTLRRMYLQEIVINGFKSFADRTTMPLNPGVVAIVGPNGCGKSNIADAIRWVLGEQSAKALRGGKMTDVIFEGSDQRKPVQLCEVSLRFADCEAQLGTAYGEVEVARRVTRDGGSDYFINGKASRLKDIQRLFMDTGVGRVSYSFLVQGQIDQILSSNPAERRIIFEEAAGITRYKAQRKETLQKLELVDRNLARVTDVIEEVGRQIGSLKRQASKAIRYKRLKHRVTHLDLAESRFRWGELDGEIKEVEGKAGGLRTRAEELTASLAEAEQQVNAQREQRSELTESLQRAQQRVYDMRASKESAENKAEFAEVRKKDAEEQIGKIEVELKRLEEQAAELERQAKSDSESRQTQLNLMSGSDEEFQSKNRDLAGAQERLNAHEKGLQERKQKLLMLESSITRLRSNCTTLEVELKSGQARQSGLRDNLASLSGDAEKLEAEGKDLERARAKREGEQQKLETQMAEAKEALGDRLGDFRERQKEIQERDRALARKSTQLGIYEKLDAQLEGVGAGAKAILQGKLADLLPPEKITPLNRGLQVEEAWTGAVETLLGPLADALAGADLETVQATIERLADKKTGSAAFFFTRAGAGAWGGALGEPGAKVLAASQVVEAEDPALAEALEAALAGDLLAESLADLLAFLKANPEVRFRSAATKDGALVDGRGFIIGGRSSGKAEASVLQRRNEIRRLKKELEAERKELDAQQEQAKGIQEQIDEIEATVEELRGRQSETSRELSTIEAQKTANQRAREANAQQRERAERDLRQGDEKRGEQAQQLEAAREKLSGAEGEIASARQAIETAEQELAAAREARDARREALNDARLEMSEKRQRLETLERTLSSLEAQKKDIENTSTRRRQEIDTLREQIQTCDYEAGNQRAAAEQIERTLGVTMESLDKERARLKEVEQELLKTEEALKTQREAERQASSQLSQLDVRLAQLQSKREFIADKVRGEYQLEVGGVDWKRQLWEADREFKRVSLDDLEEGEELEAEPKQVEREPFPAELQPYDHTDWAPLREEIEELRGRLNSMGPVNLVAIQEYADLRQRYGFLKEQSDDLWQSKEQLTNAIEELNATSQQLFADTFEQIRKNFKYTYDNLTGGGIADLELADTEDVLDSGIEIIARPPGTRLKSLSLLSGGQKTMTAVALLFAIYMVKPSPFCVLDELDAPLDDANIGRFCEMLKRFTEYSQFLIITHNKRTIAAADLIFGVTMPEKGVSKLLSMRFNKGADRPETETGKTIAIG
ncbi:MAG: chromosome segregation protein SMC [Verrucomicrobiota bacterium]